MRSKRPAVYTRRACTLFLSAQEVGEDQDGTAGQEYHPNKDGAVAEKLLRHNQDDLVGGGIEDPVVLAGEENGVEDHKGPVKIQSGQSGQYQHKPTGGYAGPKAGAVPQQRFVDPLFSKPENQKEQAGGSADAPYRAL